MSCFKQAFDWAKEHSFSEEACKYAMILELKILDKKCQMSDEDQKLFQIVYAGMRHQGFTPFNEEIFETLQQVSYEKPILLEPFKSAIHSYRKACEKEMNRPTMKAYKAMVRQAISKIDS